MQRFRWIALQGSSRGLLPPLLLFCFITTSGIPAHAADDPTACRVPVARVVSIQGSIEVLRAPQNDWIKVTHLDTPLCEGDRLRTSALSRAALFIQPETLVRVDQNTSISVSQTAEETLVEFTQEEVLPAAASAYTCGAGYFITRFPRKFRVKTPHLNAAVEGTEFLVAMRCEITELSVFEGKVLAAGTEANIFPAQSISSGQMLTIGGSEPPTVKLLVKPTDAVQWVVYYSPLSDATAEADLSSADQCRSLPKPLDQTCLTQRAEALLRLGRVDEAQREVNEAVALDPGSGDANALRAIISIARNDKAGAIEAATAATTASPNSYRAWLAISYAQQASFKLEDSLSSAQKAQTLEPNSSVTNARVAELLMSLGRIKEAEKAARAAVDANPSESRAHTVLGFVHLAQIKTKDARADFLAAIERDSSDPLPRLGLGLAIIRDGKLADGREQLEIAVALDPTNSLLRSYVGKAYYEENSRERDQLAATQFDLAKQLDPNDPTPSFYDAILKQTQNRPVDALEDLEASIALNDNRAAYRSRLLLDEDLAARGTNLARVYGELGFRQRSRLEGSKSISVDPTSHSAHRLLADSYFLQPRHEIGRLSELLQSQLWDPLAQQPLQPQLSEGSLFIVEGTGPSSASFNEFTPLFATDRLSLLANGIIGSNNTQGDDLVVGGLLGPLAVGLGQFHYETDGFRANNGQDQDLASVFLQTSPSASVSLQAEYRGQRRDRGDIALRFDSAKFSTAFRENLTVDTYRLGGRYDFSARSQLIGSLIQQATEENRHDEQLIPPTPFPGSLTVDTRFSQDSYLAELQHVLRLDKVQFISGGGYFWADEERSAIASTTLTVPFPPFTITSTLTNLSPEKPHHTNGYVYSQLTPLAPLKLTVGLSIDEVETDTLDYEQVNPKFGLVWTQGSTVLRAAAFRMLTRDLVTFQTIEPTQVAGFNQLFDDSVGTDSKRYGMGVDHKFSSRLFIGAEATFRELDVPFFDIATSTQMLANADEQLHRAYGYWVPTTSIALSTEFQFDKRTRDADIVEQGYDYLELTTRRVPIVLRWFGWSSLSASLTASYVEQSGVFLDSLSAAQTTGKSQFWQTDLELSLRLPRRTGAFSVGAINIFDKTFNFHEADPENPTVYPERFLYGRLTLAF